MPPHGLCPSAAAVLSSDPHGLQPSGEHRVVPRSPMLAWASRAESRCEARAGGCAPLRRKGFRCAAMNAPPLRVGPPLPPFTPGLAWWLLAESMTAFLFDTGSDRRNRLERPESRAAH